MALQYVYDTSAANGPICQPPFSTWTFHQNVSGLVLSVPPGHPDSSQLNMTRSRQWAFRQSNPHFAPKLIHFNHLNQSSLYLDKDSPGLDLQEGLFGRGQRLGAARQGRLGLAGHRHGTGRGAGGRH